VKKILLFFFVLHSVFSDAQIICIYCYAQNNHISSNVTNFISNGSFETSTCNPNLTTSCFCPNSNFYSCDITNWTCTGGGVNTYAHIKDYNNVLVPDGNKAAYFGNNFANACSPSFGDLSCVTDSGCTLIGFPQGFPQNNNLYGGSQGISLSQTVSGLVTGDTYVLEFWAGGESDTIVNWVGSGIFAVDIGFGYNYFWTYPTASVAGIGTRFIIEFRATSASHTIKFTNWGHVCQVCTELAIDDVRLYPLAELAGFVPSCVAPVAGFSASNMICPGTCVTFQNLSTDATSYQWSFPGAVPDTSTDVNPANICFNNPGSYNVSLIAGNGTAYDTLTINNYIFVFPQPPPQAIFQSGDSLFANAGSASYQWYYNGNLIASATDYFYVASANGDYNIIATDSNGCEVEAAIFGVITSAQAAAGSSSMQLEIFPNPVDKGNKLAIRSGLPIVKGMAMRGGAIFNLLGELVMSVDLKSGSFGTFSKPAATEGILPTCTVDVSQIPPGVYYLEISSADKIFRVKFVKQ